jgi:hypothetical protein
VLQWRIASGVLVCNLFQNQIVILSERSESKDLRFAPTSTKRRFFDSLRSLRMTAYLLSEAYLLIELMVSLSTG